MADRYVTRGHLKSRIPEIIKKLPHEIDEAQLAGAEAVAEVARFLVPKESGRLMESIHIERTYDRGRVLTWVVAWSRKAFYGHFVEYGTVRPAGGGSREHSRGWATMALRSGAAESFTAPHPFMVPAAEAGRKLYEEDTRAAIRRAVE